ncbi:MAG: YdcF family protein [Bryocella sp.]
MKSYARSLRASGKYPLYSSQDEAHLLATAWVDAAKAMNHIVDVYGDGVAPHYAQIDSMRYDPKTRYYFTTVHTTAMLIEDEASKIDDVFFPELKFAVMLLAANGRMDAARDWPLENSKNAAAVARVKSIHWDKYPYSVIVVPGQGPEIPEEEFSPMGRAVVEIAVREYREGKAPFLVVSGGTVHPELTKYCEAYEMKRELMTQWKVPESAIIVEPYARHTTTNIRNVVRELVRYGIPMKKPMLIASDSQQIKYVAAASFDDRCRNEMRVVPYTNKRKLSATEISMQPDAIALQMDADDPMDP